MFSRHEIYCSGGNEHSYRTDVAQVRWHNVLTTDTSAKSDADGTQGIVSGGGNFTGAPRPVAIRVYQVVTRHRVLVVVVHVVTRLRILQRQQTVNPAVLQLTDTICAEPTELSQGPCRTNPTIFQQRITGVHKFSKKQEPPQNSRHRKGDAKQVSYWGPINIRCHIIKFCSRGNWHRGFSIPDLYTSLQNHFSTPSDTVTLTLRLLMSHIYGAPILDVSRSHTTTHHSR